MESFFNNLDVRAVFKAILDPFVIFTRVQGKDDGSYGIRQVYCPTWRITILEIMFGKELVSWFVASDTSSALLGKTQQQVSSRMMELRPYHKYCLDYSKFDQTLNPYVLLTAFDMVSQRLELSDFMHRIFWMLVSHICLGRIYHPSADFSKRTRGMMSGSYFTNIIDSICNLIIIWYAIYACGYQHSVAKIIVHGDDLIICTKSPIDISKLSAPIAEIGMGYKASAEHSIPAGVDKVHFLGSEWCCGKPERSIVRMGLSAIHLKSR